jgi:hypothetical protein
MRGVEFTISTVIRFVLLIAVVLICFYFIAGPVLGAKANMDLDFQIKKLCPDWVKKDCDKNLATSDDDLKTKVGTQILSLSELCSLRFTGVKSKWDDPGIYEDCKNACVGACPTSSGGSVG